MGWELWTTSTSYGWSRVGFFCNTADESFGPVVSVEVDTEHTGTNWFETVIYDTWDEAVRFLRVITSDPRSMGRTTIYKVCQAVFYLAGWQTGEEFEDSTGHELDIHGHILWGDEEE